MSTPNHVANILIVDDRPENLIALEAILDLPDICLVRANSGQEALDCLLEKEFALIFMDVQMPGMDGFETVRLIHGTARTRHVPVIFVTAISKEERYIFKGYESGAVDYLFKPLERDIVRGKARVFLKLYRQREELSQKTLALERINFSLKETYQQMKQDLDAAARVQQALLPSRAPENEHVSFAWNFQPCEELAGDIFDVFRIDAQHLGMYLLDVSGHGVQAALLSSALSHVLNAQAGPGALPLASSTNDTTPSPAPPSEVLQQLNQRYRMDFHIGQYFTIVYGKLNERSGQLTFSAAGHPGPILQRGQKDSCSVLPCPGPPIGWFAPNHEFNDHTVQLEPGDRILFYSDGIIEAENGARKELGEEGILSYVRANPECPLQQLIDGLAGLAESWQAPPITDDISILALQYDG